MRDSKVVHVFEMANIASEMLFERARMSFAHLCFKSRRFAPETSDLMRFKSFKSLEMPPASRACLLKLSELSDISSIALRSLLISAEVSAIVVKGLAEFWFYFSNLPVKTHVFCKI